MPFDTLPDLFTVPRLVLKVGSSLLVRQGKARRQWLETLAQDIAALRAAGTDVIVVSSGAIALGAAKLGMAKGGRGSLADAQAAAAVGQVELARLWSDVLGTQDMIAAQMLVTLGDLEQRRSYLNAAATIERLLESGAVPVINENDSIATEEIRFGDNDRLAARVAQASAAAGVVLLSDVDGLYDGNPGDPRARLVERVEGLSDDVRNMAGGSSSSGIGSGGMISKLQAVEISERAGIALAIVNGTGDAPIARARESGRGTLFVPRRKDTARKAWLGGRLAPKGVLTVDEGCGSALAAGSSLLAVGLTAVEGAFRRGDLVAIHSARGDRLAQGLVEYDAPECRAIIGLKLDEQADILGYAPRGCVIHRDHMVLL